MDENCVITPCKKTEHESELTPVNTYYGMAYEADSLESIQNPNENHIYLVDGTAYVYVDGEFKSLGYERPTVTDKGDGIVEIAY